MHTRFIIKRLPIAFLLLGLLFKTALVGFFRFWHHWLVLRLALYYDPGAWYFAEKVTNLFIRHESTARDAAIFDISLVLAFGLECFLVGLAFQWLWRRLPSEN